MTPLLLDLVRAPEHAIDACQVICTGEQGVGVASRDVVFLEMSFLAEVAHLGIVKSRDRKENNVFGEKTYLIIYLRRDGPSRLQSCVDIELLLNLFYRTLHLEREHGASETAAVAEHANALTLEGFAGDVGK